MTETEDKEAEAITVASHPISDGRRCVLHSVVVALLAHILLRRTAALP